MFSQSLYLYIGLGFLLESIFLLGNALKSKTVQIQWLCCFLGGLVGLVPARHEHIYSLEFHLVLTAIFFAFIYLRFFGKKMLPVVNEQSLAIFNTVFVFQYFFIIHRELSRHSINDLSFFYAIGLITLVVFVNAFIRMTVPYFLKLIFYVWYLVMASILLFYTLYQMQFFQWAVQSYTFVTYLALFSVGMVLFNLSMDVITILYLIPLPAKNQSYSERLENIKRHIQLLTSKYLDEDVEVLQNMFVIALLIALLLANERYYHINQIFILNAVLIANRYLTGNFILKEDAN